MTCVRRRRGARRRRRPSRSAATVGAVDESRERSPDPLSTRVAAELCRGSTTSALPVLATSPLPAGMTTTMLGLVVLAEEAAVAARGDDRDARAPAVGEVADLEVVGAVAGDVHGGLGRVGGASRRRRRGRSRRRARSGSGVSKVRVQAVDMVSPGCVRPTGRRVPVRVVRGGPGGVRWVRASRSSGGCRACRCCGERVVADEGDALERSMSTLIGVVGGGAPRDDVDQPGVEALPGRGRLLLGPGLDRLGDAEGDPGQVAVVLVGRRRRRRRRRGRGRRSVGRSRRRSRARGRPAGRRRCRSGSSAVISAAAWEMASISASRALGSRA